jgi:hypothetical protein
MCDARIPRSSLIALNTGRLSGRPNAKIEHRYREFSRLRAYRVHSAGSLRSSFHQVNPLSRPEGNPLACLDIA